MRTDHAQQKILIVGSSAQGALETAYLRALGKCGAQSLDMFNVDRYNFCLPGSSLLIRGSNRVVTTLSEKIVEQRFLRFLSHSGKYYDAIIVFKGREFSRRLLDACRASQPKAMWININPDNPLYGKFRVSTNSNILNSLSFYDIYCIWSRALIDELKQHGCQQVEYLPFAYDSDYHIPPPDTRLGQEDCISFIGSWDPEREETLSALTDYNLHIFGNGWERVGKKSPLRTKKIVPRAIFGEELARVVGASQLSLNLLRTQNRGSHNMRTFEVPAMGGLMLTTRSQEQDKFFPEKQACLMFGSEQELRTQVKQVQKDPTFAHYVRQQGMQQVKEHSYVERGHQLLRLILSK